MSSGASAKSSRRGESKRERDQELAGDCSHDRAKINRYSTAVPSFIFLLRIEEQDGAPTPAKRWKHSIALAFIKAAGRHSSAMLALLNFASAGSARHRRIPWLLRSAGKQEG
jgi:hypothetical protein